MSITFQGPAVLVKDIDASRRFYEQALGQQVLADHGPHLVLGGFFLWQADHAAPIMLGRGAQAPAPLGQGNFELYFETEDLDQAWQQAEEHGATALHPMVEQPWGQRGFRLADPDGHVVEVAEPLTALVARLLDSGLSPEQVSERTSIPVDMVREMAP